MVSARNVGLTEQPGFFASGAHQLYRVFHPAARRASASSVVIFCSSFGPDHVVAWRMEVLTARMAAAHGHDAVLFHPRSHGDSTGNFAEVTFDNLVEDAGAAARHAREASGAAQLVWVGVGFGALVAAAALRRDQGTRGLALWEPVHRGIDYFHAQLRRALFREVSCGRRPAATVDQMLAQLEGDGPLYLYGERVHPVLFPTFYRSARALELAAMLEGWRRPALLAQVQRRSHLSPDNAALATALAERGAKVTVATVADEPAWNGMDPPWVSDALSERTVEWLDGLD